MALFWRTIKDRRVLLLIYLLASIGVLLMYIALFPSFKDQSAGLEEMIKNFPESFMKAFNFDIKNFTTIEGFLATEQFSFMWPIITSFMIIGFSGYGVSGEVEKGTIELLLSQPISRLKLYLTRYFAGLVMFILFVACSILAAIPLCMAFNISFNASHFLTMTLLSFLFGWAIYGIGMLCSAFFSDKGKVYFVSAIVLVAMYILNILASIKESISDVKYFSFFYYFNPAKALIYNQIDHWAYLVFISVAIVTLVAGAFIFSKRDIAV